MDRKEVEQAGLKVLQEVRRFLISAHEDEDVDIPASVIRKLVNVGMLSVDGLPNRFTSNFDLPQVGQSNGVTTYAVHEDDLKTNVAKGCFDNVQWNPAAHHHNAGVVAKVRILRESELRNQLIRAIDRVILHLEAERVRQAWATPITW